MRLMDWYDGLCFEAGYPFFTGREKSLAICIYVFISYYCPFILFHLILFIRCYYYSHVLSFYSYVTYFIILFSCVTYFVLLLPIFFCYSVFVLLFIFMLFSFHVTSSILFLFCSNFNSFIFFSRISNFTLFSHYHGARFILILSSHFFSFRLILFFIFFFLHCYLIVLFSTARRRVARHRLWSLRRYPRSSVSAFHYNIQYFRNDDAF